MLYTKEWIVKNAEWCHRLVSEKTCGECPYYLKCPFVYEHHMALVKMQGVKTKLEKLGNVR